MGKRMKAGLADDVVKLVGALPWWVGLTLAPITYLAIHQFALPPEVAPKGPDEMGSHAVKVMVAAAANILQYLVPVLCLVGAGISAWKQRDRAQLAHQAANNRSSSIVDGLSWQRFEQLVGASFERQGFSVKETGGAGADGGVDLELRKGSELHLVQCKHWKALKVGVDVVRELYGAMAARGAASGYVVTSGTFTAAAREFASGRNVNLIDGAGLAAILRSADKRAPPASPKAEVPHVKPNVAESSPPPEAPSCPKCGNAMTMRAASRGANAGQGFWGCTAFPNCRGTRALTT